MPPPDRPKGPDDREPAAGSGAPGPSPGHLAAESGSETGDDSPYPSDRLLAWPPPGLERIRGDLWLVVRGAAVGSVLLVLPLLWSVGTEQAFWSLGPFGTRWWVVIVTTVLGLIILGEAFVSLFRLLRRAGRASDQGYGWVTIVEVVSDAPGDTGFLVQGARAYSTLRPDARRLLLLFRLLAAGLYLAAALWIPVGFAVGILLGSRGVGSHESIWILTVVPAAGLVVGGAVARFAEARLARRARREWFRQPWAEELAEGDAREWVRAFSERKDEGTLDPGPGHRGPVFRGAAVGVVAMAALVVLPTLSVVTVGVISPVLATIAIPHFSATQERAATAEPLRRYRIPTDPSISREAAGEALQVIAFMDPETRDEGPVLPPVRTYARGWFPGRDRGGGGPTQTTPARWAEELLPRAAAGDLDAAELAYLAELARHPAHREFELLARAGDADIAGARWETPFPPDARMYSIPLPRLGSFREGAYAQIGKAAMELAEGRADDAEETIREIVSAGLLVGDRGPTIVDNLVGYTVAKTGGEALESFYRSTGRDTAARELVWARRSVERAVDRARVASGGVGIEASLRTLPRVVTDPDAIRGLRWEYFMNVAGFAPCMNLHRIVFGPDRSYREWVEEARAALVTSEAEAALFDVARRGFLGAEGSDGTVGILGGLLTLPLGAGGGPGSCAAMLGGLGTGTEVR